MGTPVVTSLVVIDEPVDLRRPDPVPPWKAPFTELLGLLKIIDASQPNPQLDGQRFCFQPSCDLSEISRIFISVTIPGLRYDIDLKTIRASDSSTVPPAVTKLQEYANHALQRTQLLRDQLLKVDPTTDIARFLEVDLLTCPLCRLPLLSCVDCDSVVACSGALCKALREIPCEICWEHMRMLCHACLDKNDSVPSLVKCPTCQGWCCKEDAEWCTGLITYPALDSEEMAEVSSDSLWDLETIVRSHSPKPDGCGFCVDRSEGPARGWVICRNSGEELEVDRCPSQTPFMTKIRIRGAYCPQCVEQSPGCLCACGGSWLCATCVAIGNKNADYPYHIVCPRCGVSYCTDSYRHCKAHIDICRDCKGAILCKSCQEEEALPGEVQTATDRPKEVVLDQRCSRCKVWTCTDCRASSRSAACVVCRKWFCHDCVGDPDRRAVVPCDFCGARVCTNAATDCRAHHPQTCPILLMMMNARLRYPVPAGTVVHPGS